jgi:hypothetical protein
MVVVLAVLVGSKNDDTVIEGDVRAVDASNLWANSVY